MESIKVTPESLIAKAAQVDSEASEYYNEYRGLLSDVESLTGSDWTGEDANAFREKVEGFEPDFNKMKELMNEYANFLREAAKNYQNTQENVIANIKSLR
ncbi:MAG: WXG100 family type VII secretion target [Lachnospiraceae bacterium]|nr:WXG100 family type VII secretion target [Lachnospiraceae bacterium]